MARKRAGKWNDDDRDLAERELAAVVVEKQKVRLVSDFGAVRVLNRACDKGSLCRLSSETLVATSIPWERF